MGTLRSQARQIMVWFDGSKVSYVIPMYQGLESCLGANLEIQLDLQRSHNYQQQLQRILKNPKEEPLLCLPRNSTPLPLSWKSSKTTHKTLVEGREEIQQQQELQ